MMDRVFLTVLNMSITATYVLVVVLVLRLLLKHAPKWTSYALWSIILVRLVCPVSFTASFSLLGRMFKPTNDGRLEYIPSNIGNMPVPVVDIGIPGINKIINDTLPGASQTASANPLQVWVSVMAMIWAAGFLIMLIYSILAHRQLRHRIHTATRITENIFETDKIDSPFVFGVFNPRIYLPVGMDEMNRSYVLLHERAHLRRFDHVTKPLAFLVLSIHWFNPFMWIAFRLMSRDMEMSCDEHVVVEMNREEKANYGAALVRLALNRPVFNGSPLSFGESRIKDRVTNILNFRKPVIWVMIGIVILMIISGIALLANPPINANQDDLSTLDGFTAALKWHLGSVVDITEQENQKRSGNLTEHQRILQVDSEHVFAELAVDQTLEKIVNDRLADINNPLIDRIWPVHLYVKGNLVVEYSGKNEIILDALVKLLGTELPHDVPFTGTRYVDNITTSYGEIDIEQAIAIAKSRFAEYLLTKPEMKVVDPVYTANKKQYQDNSEYWSVTIKLNEPEYMYYYYEVLITMDGEQVTLATG
ncbi:MAG: M56 family metallopeptidase [Clostridiaceae bacterium]|nr:M56 family metallopeptidase [Clostridiaceae bacterium]